MFQNNIIWNKPILKDVGSAEIPKKDKTNLLNNFYKTLILEYISRVILVQVNRFCCCLNRQKYSKEITLLFWGGLKC